MENLQKLDVCWNVSKGLIQILKACTSIKDLTIRIQKNPRGVQKPYSDMYYLQLQAEVCSFLCEWKENGFMPSNLNMVCHDDLSSLIDEVIGLWPALLNSCLPAGHTAHLRLYTDLKAPLNLFPALPVLQVHFGEGAMAPCVDASKLGLKNDLMILSNFSHGSNMAYKVGLWNDRKNINSYQVSDSCIILKSVIECDLSFPVNINHSDLDRLAVTCPNLQRLDLSFTSCSENLQGLRSIANCCHNLKGLNLLGVQVMDLENHIKLWDILSDFKLTHLAIELCNIIPFEDDDAGKQNLVSLYQTFLQLKALHLAHDENFSCLRCKSYNDKHAVLLSHFPSLACCLLNAVPYRCSDTIKNIVANCKELKYLRCCYSKTPGMCAHPPVTVSCNLQQLFINSTITQATDSFMRTISAHGSLVHVFLCVSFISQEGMATLIINSPKLLTFHVVVCAILQEDPELVWKSGHKLPQLSLDDVRTKLNKRFSNKKLFRINGFDIEKQLKTLQGWEELNLDVMLNLF